MTHIKQWINASDWHWLTVFVIVQFTLVGLWFLFALWVSDYARLNWY